MKAVAGVQSRLFQLWIFGALLYGTVNLIVGIGLLARARLFPNSTLFGSLLEATGAAWAIILLWALYQSLAFARDSGDLQIRRPLVWLLFSFLPLLNLYTAFAVYPRIFPPWIKRMSQISISSNQVLAFMLLTSCANIILRIDSLEALVLSFLADGIAKLSLVWMLRDVLLNRTAD
jgi:hypothetical protein